MFEAIESLEDRDGSIRASLTLPEMGLKYFVEFRQREGIGGQHQFTQLVSRVHAVPPRLMIGLPVPHTWATCLRYHIVVMDQHLPNAMSIDCSRNQ